MKIKWQELFTKSFSVLVLTVLFNRTLSPRAAWPVLTFLAIGTGLFLFLQVLLLTLFDIPYFDQDHSAWVLLHVAGFATLSMIAIATRLSNWRIASDRRLPKIRRFSTREVGLRTASLAVLLALTQCLIKTDL